VTLSIRKIMAAVVVVIFAIVMSVSYYVMARFAFFRNEVMYGRKLSDLVPELQEKILKNKNVQQVSFMSSDGIKLSGILVNRSNAKINYILCHGYRANKETMYSYLDIFPNDNIFMFDFRAHGQSEGSITSIGCHEYKDVLAAIDYMKNTLGKEGNLLPTILLGISMGGASCLRAMQESSRACDALVVDSTFADLEKTILRVFDLRAKLPYYPFYNVMKSMFHYFGKCNVSTMSTVDMVKNIRQPILFMHSCNDSFILPEHSVQLYANSFNKKTKIWIAPRCRHGWLHVYYPDRYRTKVESFLKKVL
jgi:uncharacterized protein